jgi:hypothetical protein
MIMSYKIQDEKIMFAIKGEEGGERINFKYEHWLPTMTDIN